MMRFVFVFFLLLSFSGFSQHLGNIKKVVIDAGHGGKDHGCSGASSNEKDVVLNISLKLGKLIEEHIKDVEVIYTRKTDVFVELHKRAERANKAKADIFICIHANANNNKAIFGTETFIMGLHKTSESLKVQQRENKSILYEENHQSIYDNFDPESPESYIIFSLYQNMFLEQSIDFANKIEKQFSERAKRKSRGVRQAGFIVLFKTSMPSVLVETGFLTNRTEEKFLNSDYGQDLIASAIYRALKEYKTEVDKKHSETLTTIEKEKKEQQKQASEKKKRDQEMRKRASKTKKNTNNLYRIQLAVLKEAKDLNKNLKAQEFKIEYYKANNHFYYYSGKNLSRTEAQKLLKKVQQNGFKDAFITQH